MVLFFLGSYSAGRRFDENAHVWKWDTFDFRAFEKWLIKTDTKNSAEIPVSGGDRVSVIKFPN